MVNVGSVQSPVIPYSDVMLMFSLKSFLPILAEILDRSVDALYERQRALVRLRLLRQLPGRGRGTGVRLSANSVATLLSSLLATDNLSDIDARVRRLYLAQSEEGACQLTQTLTFGHAIEHLLRHQEHVYLVKSVVVNRKAESAEISYTSRLSVPGNVTVFRQSRVSSNSPALETQARLSGKAMQKIAWHLAKEGGENI